MLCVRFRQGNVVTRYAFWTDDDAVLPNVPLYDGELLPKNIVLECWSLNGQTSVSNDDETVVGLSLRKIVTDFSIAPADYDDSDPTIIPASSISVSLVAGPSLPIGSAFHYDAASLALGAVSSWADSSGNGRHLVQATGANQPTAIAVVMAGGNFQAVSFDGINDYLTDALAINKDVTLYLMMNQVAWKLYAAVLGLDAAATAHVLQFSEPYNLNLTLASTASDATELGIGAFGILTIQLKTAPGLNNIKIGEFPTHDSIFGRQLERFSVGADYTGANPSSIQVAEILSYNALHDAATQLQVRQYLANKYFGGGPLPMVFGANNQWLDNPGFPSLVPNATPPPPPVVPDVTPPVAPLQGLGDPLAGTVLGDPATGKILG